MTDPTIVGSIRKAIRKIRIRVSCWVLLSVRVYSFNDSSFCTR